MGITFEDVDDAAIKQFSADLCGMTPAAVEEAIREAQSQIDEIEPWLEALHAYKRRLAPTMATEIAFVEDAGGGQ